MAKRDDWDDGRVIAPMDNVGHSPLRPSGSRIGKERGSNVTRKERRAMMRALFAVMLPRLLIVLLSFAVVGILCYLWLSGGV